MNSKKRALRVGVVAGAVVVVASVVTATGAQARPATVPAESAAGRSGGAAPAARVVEGSYIVRFAAGADAPVTAAAIDHGGTPVQRTFHQVFDGAVVHASPAEAEALRHDPRVASIEQDQVVTAETTQPGAPWGIDRSDQRSGTNGAYTYGATGVGVTAYVVDSGIRADHLDFGGRVRQGYTAVDDGNGFNDCAGHGTHVSGTIGGATYGMAKGISLVNVRVLNCVGEGTVSGMLGALEWLTNDHAAGQPAVANISITTTGSDLVDAAVAAVIADGVTVVAAAGNQGGLACNYSPARLASVITVAATDSTDYSPNWSNYGACLDLFAPGQDITSDFNSSSTATATATGTSMASPHVTGAAALLLAEKPWLAPSEVAAKLYANATLNIVTNAGDWSPNRLLYAPPILLNDNFAGATPFDLLGPSSIFGMTISGTREAGEPLHAGLAGAASAWWLFIPPADGTVTITTQGSTFDTLLGVYQGASVSTLTPIASNNNALGVQWSSVSFHVGAGQAYRVAVDGYLGQRGDVVLNLGYKIDGAFIDVPLTHPFYVDIKWMLDAGLVSGFSDGTYRPTAPVSRQAMAAFLYRYKGAPLGQHPTCASAPASDVPVDAPFCGEIKWLIQSGIASGYPDGTFQPAAGVSRQAMAAFLYRVADSPNGLHPTCAVAPFTDVKAAAPFCGEITWLVAEQIAGGYPDGTFHPASSVSRQAMAAFLHRLAT